MIEQWEIMGVVKPGVKDGNLYSREGWEPFAIDAHRVWFKRFVVLPDPPPAETEASQLERMDKLLQQQAPAGGPSSAPQEEQF